MTITARRWLLTALTGAALVLLGACVAGGGGYYGGVDVGYSADYYEPWGYDYGGWGPGYWVGPPRNGWGWHHHNDSRPPPYHPVQRSAPSIPNRRR
jgi:hypothetical protein